MDQPLHRASERELERVISYQGAANKGRLNAPSGRPLALGLGVRSFGSVEGLSVTRKGCRQGKSVIA